MGNFPLEFLDLWRNSIPRRDTVRSAAFLHRSGARETGASRHHVGAIKGTPEIPHTTPQYGTTSRGVSRYT